MLARVGVAEDPKPVLEPQLLPKIRTIAMLYCYSSDYNGEGWVKIFQKLATYYSIFSSVS